MSDQQAGAPATRNIDKVIATERHGRGLFFTTVDVEAVERPTPRLARITFRGEGLAGFHLPCANVAVRLFFPRDGERLEPLAAQDDMPDAARALRARSRVYTARRFDPDTLRVVVDFVLHDGGLAGGWAAGAEAGQRLLFSGPRPHHVPPADASHLLFAADETALPALHTIAAALPAGASGHAFVSIADPAERQPLDIPPGVVVEWVDRSAGGSLLDAVRRWSAAPPRRGARPVAWLAGELHETRALRALLHESGYPAEMVQSFPYWRRGSDGTELSEAQAAAVVAAVDAGRDPASLDPLDVPA